MAKADVLQFVTDFSLSQSDQTEAGLIYDEVVRELAFKEVLTGTETIPVETDTAVYQIAPATIMMLELHLRNVGRLDKINGRSLRSVYGSEWRNRVGIPCTYTQEQQDDDKFQLVPRPTHDNTLTVIRTETRTDVPSWLELALTFEILHREYLRESDHQDIEFSSRCRLVANMLFTMVGLERDNGQQTR